MPVVPATLAGSGGEVEHVAAHRRRLAVALDDRVGVPVAGPTLGDAVAGLGVGDQRVGAGDGAAERVALGDAGAAEHALRARTSPPSPAASPRSMARL